MYKPGPPRLTASVSSLPPDPPRGPKPTCPSTTTSASLSQPPTIAVTPKGRTLEYKVYACTYPPNLDASALIGIGPLYVLRQLLASSLPLLVKCLPSGNNPEVTIPIFWSTVAMRLFVFGLRSFDEMIFSMARTTPKRVRMPMQVPPFSTAFTAYST